MELLAYASPWCSTRFTSSRPQIGICSGNAKQRSDGCHLSDTIQILFGQAKSDKVDLCLHNSNHCKFSSWSNFPRSLMLSSSLSSWEAGIRSCCSTRTQTCIYEALSPLRIDWSLISPIHWLMELAKSLRFMALVTIMAGLLVCQFLLIYEHTKLFSYYSHLRLPV